MSNEYETRREFTFTWRIENCFSYFRNEFLRSPEITTENLEGRKWKLILSPGGFYTEGYVSCFLYRSENDIGADTIFIDYEIEIIGVEGNTLKSHKCENSAFGKGDAWGWSKFMKRDQLFKKIKYWTNDILTIRCHMKSAPRKKPTTGCEVRTKINAKKDTIEWNVKINNPSDWSETKSILFHELATLEISLSAPEYAPVVKILYFPDGKHRSLFASGRISFLNVKGIKRYSKKARHDFESGGETWQFPYSFSIRDLEAEKDTFVKNGTFTLLCEFSVSYGIESETVEKCTYDTLDSCAFSVLHDNLRDMLTSKKHYDVLLHADNKTLPAHKSILAARSPVFSTMFELDVIESQPRTVNICVDVNIQKSFLVFMYTGAVDDMDYESCLKLMIVADKFQVLSLKEKCSSFLIPILSEENACEILAIADMVRHQLLKESTVDYIIANAERILTSSKWSQWIEKNDRLAKEIFSKLASLFGTASNELSGELVKKSCANERPEKLRISELEISSPQRT